LSGSLCFLRGLPNRKQADRASYQDRNVNGACHAFIHQILLNLSETADCLGDKLSWQLGILYISRPIDGDLPLRQAVGQIEASTNSPSQDCHPECSLSSREAGRKQAKDL
jgi:hypothetical protein